MTLTQFMTGVVAAAGGLFIGALLGCGVILAYAAGGW